MYQGKRVRRVELTTLLYWMLVFWDVDIHQLTQLMTEVISIKWGEDIDGDAPVQCQLINRRRYQGLKFRPLPHVRSQKDLAHFLRAASSNLSMAQDDIKLATMRVLDILENEE